MAIKINELLIVHSGGAANSDPAASLGGAISTHANKRVRSQVAAAPTNVTGVIIQDAYGNAEGIGSLYYASATQSIGWRPAGEAVYAYTAVPTDGSYTVGTSAGYIVIDVTVASLPGSDKVDAISVVGAFENTFLDVPESASLLGAVYYRCFYLLNSNGLDTAQDVRIWVAENTQAGDTIEIALDPGGLNTTALGPLADQEDSTDVLSALTWVSPNTYTGALQMGNIPTGQYYAFWQRQTIPIETRGTVLANRARLAVAALV